jgi:glutathione S-transferase
MKHYTCSWAPNPYKVRLAFAELGVPAEHLEMDSRNRENRRPAFLQVNPNGRLPVIDDEGFLLWESNAILSYLAKKHPEKKLWPETARGEADALRWLFYETSTLQPAIADVWWARWLTPRLGSGIPPAVPEPSVSGLERPLNVLNDHIRTREWVLGAFSVVDCALAAPLLMMELSEVPMDRWNGVASYWRRWKTRASFAATPFKFPGEAPTPS